MASVFVAFLSRRLAVFSAVFLSFDNRRRPASFSLLTSDLAGELVRRRLMSEPRGLPAAAPEVAVAPVSTTMPGGVRSPSRLVQTTGSAAISTLV